MILALHFACDSTVILPLYVLRTSIVQVRKWSVKITPQYKLV